MLESETPSAAKRVCLRKKHKGSFKVCILACTELQWEIKTPPQCEQQAWGSASPAAAGELRCCLPHCGKVHELTYCTGSWRDHLITPDAGFLLGVLIHKGDTLRGAGGTSPMGAPPTACPALGDKRQCPQPPTCGGGLHEHVWTEILHTNRTPPLFYLLRGSAPAGWDLCCHHLPSRIASSLLCGGTRGRLSEGRAHAGRRADVYFSSYCT